METEFADKLFNLKPVSFKIDRKSQEAANLRDAVSRKLFDFLGNYSDEVLAEYIAVLVCNGKHQNQARDDLEAFLGDDSARFVAWLWNYLFKENYISKTHLDSSNFTTEVASNHENVLNKTQKTSMPDLPAHATGISDMPSPKDGRHGPSYCHADSNCSNTIEVPESLQRWCPGMDGPLNKVNNERPQAETLIIDEDSAVAASGRAKYLSSTVRFSPGITSGDELCLHYEYQHQKVAQIDSGAMLQQPLPIPRIEQIAGGLKSIITEDHPSRALSIRNSPETRLLSTDTNVVPHQIPRPRGNVWDRLGKPCNEDDTEMRRKNYQHGVNLVKRKRLECQEEELQKPRSMWVVPDARLSNNSAAEPGLLAPGQVISNNHSKEYRTHENNSNSMADLTYVGSSKQRRLYNQSISGNNCASFSASEENHLQVKEAPPKLQGSLSVKYNRLDSLKEVKSVIERSIKMFPEAAGHSVITATEERNSQANKVSSCRLNRRDSVTTPIQNLVTASDQLPSKLESRGNAECGNATRRPVKDEVLNVKSRLRQVEMDMLKLRAKQAEMSTDAKPIMLSGVENHSEEDIESRTVLVTNVHFAATREALLSHFIKCGVVVKVVILTDTVTAQPKGAACIVFANKDSVDRAVSLSGTSFFSRILTVMKKADMPPGFLVPLQPAGKLLPPSYPQPYKKGSASKQYASPHLQWRRDHPVNRENSLSATTNGLVSSNTGE